MQRHPVDERLVRGSRLVVAVEVPLVIDDPDLEEHPVLRVGAGHRILLVQMKPPLLLLASVGPEDRFPRKRVGARQWMIVDEQRIVLPVELDGFADGRIDDSRFAENSRPMAADVLEAVERPCFVIGSACGLGGA